MITFWKRLNSVIRCNRRTIKFKCGINLAFPPLEKSVQNRPRSPTRTTAVKGGGKNDRTEVQKIGTAVCRGNRQVPLPGRRRKSCPKKTQRSPKRLWKLVLRNGDLQENYDERFRRSRIRRTYDFQPELNSHSTQVFKSTLVPSLMLRLIIKSRVVGSQILSTRWPYFICII